MKKILVWGTGKLAERFIKNGCNGEILGFIETNKSADSYMGKPIYDSRQIPDQYDYIIVANSHTTEIYNLAIKLNINCSKIIFLYGVKRREGCVDTDVLKEILLEKNYTDYCGEFNLTEGSFIDEDARTYARMNRRANFEIKEEYIWPVIRDKYAAAGTIGNYFWQDLWAGRLVIGSGVKNHFDIASRLDGFIAHLLAAGIDVTMIDVREFPEKVEHLHTIVDDATSLRQIPDDSIESISALCSLEHFGLGRYGDPIDPEACFKCFDSIQRKLKKNGKLYLSLPIGKERLEFNAHRVFYPSTIIESFASLKLEEFSCTAQGKIEYNIDIHKYDNDLHNGNYRYGLFYFTKP
ncbi:MAG: DUF268 domain-containing protein [Dorea sp.]|jgi:hypothetical protein|nr:DUF268 domain-containing protein [Dorea sp.]